MKDILFLEKMITPKLALIGYWLSSILIIGAGLYGFFNDYFIEDRLISLVGMVFSLIGIRIMFELTVLFFNMYSELKKIRGTLESNKTTLAEEITHKKSQESQESQDE